MITNILKSSAINFKKIYLFALQITILKLIPFEITEESGIWAFLISILLFIIGIFAEYYKNFLSLRSTKKELKINSIKKDFKVKFKRWILSGLRVLFEILKKLIPTIILFAVAGEMFNQDYHILTNIIGLILISGGAYFLVKLINVFIELSMTGLIAIEKKQSSKEILESSKNITKNNKTFLIKIGIVTAAVAILISVSSWMLIFNYILGLNQINTLNITTSVGILIYLLVDNIATSFALNVHGQTYKSIKK